LAKTKKIFVFLEFIFALDVDILSIFGGRLYVFLGGLSPPAPNCANGSLPYRTAGQADTYGNTHENFINLNVKSFQMFEPVPAQFIMCAFNVVTNYNSLIMF